MTTPEQPDTPATPDAEASNFAGSVAQDTSRAPGNRKRSRARRDRDLLTHLFATLGKFLGVVVTLVTLIGGMVTLLFQVDPTLEPCIGGAGATFSNMEVVPDYSYTEFIRDVRQGIDNDEVPPNLPQSTGAEVRYNYSTSNLSGNDLRLYLTLLEVKPNGDVAIPPGFAPGAGVLDVENLHGPDGLRGDPHPVVTPTRCSQESSGLDYIPLPPARPVHRYEIVLEFYEGASAGYTDRVGVGRTAIFDY